MTSNGQTHDIAEIRKLLAAAFDDVGLVALCQDEFPALCESLGRGLRKDEILNVILDHFRRRGDFGPLLTAVRAREPALYASFFEPTSPPDRGSIRQVLRVSAVWQGAIVIVGLLACIVIVLAIRPMQTVLWPPTPTLAPSPTIEIDLSRASASSDDGSSITISATETSLEINYDLGTGGWVQVTVQGNLEGNLDLSYMENQGASMIFSLEGTGAANSFEVKVEDTDGTNYGWLSAPGESVTPNRPLRLPLDSFVYWWGTDATMNWQQVKNIMFAVSKKPGDEGGKGQVIVKDVVITP